MFPVNGDPDSDTQYQMTREEPGWEGRGHIWHGLTSQGTLGTGTGAWPLNGTHCGSPAKDEKEWLEDIGPYEWDWVGRSRGPPLLGPLTRAAVSPASALCLQASVACDRCQATGCLATWAASTATRAQACKQPRAEAGYEVGTILLCRCSALSLVREGKGSDLFTPLSVLGVWHAFDHSVKQWSDNITQFMNKNLRQIQHLPPNHKDLTLETA
jgi:hypothetical protein